MTVPDTQTHPDDLIDAIVANLTAAFPALRVEAYRTDRRDMVLPACMIALVDMEPSPPDDPGTTQLAVLARIEAHVILGFRTTDAMREAPKAAAAAAVQPACSPDALLARGAKHGLTPRACMTGRCRSPISGLSGFLRYELPFVPNDAGRRLPERLGWLLLQSGGPCGTDYRTTWN